MGLTLTYKVVLKTGQVIPASRQKGPRQLLVDAERLASVHLVEVGLGADHSSAHQVLGSCRLAGRE